MNTTTFAKDFEYLISIKCSICKTNRAQDEHTCPYAEDINDDGETLCDCCSSCEENCRMDI